MGRALDEKGGMEMAVIRFQRPMNDIFAEMERLRNEIDRIFQEGFGGVFTRERTGVFPPVNVYEDKDRYVLTAELPGVKPEDVEITVTEESVTLRGQRKQEDGGEKANYHRREREYGSFRRVVSLPDRVDPNKVEATSRHGILYVTLPKAEDVKPRHIKVKSAD
jgi:HSP20 family protein